MRTGQPSHQLVAAFDMLGFSHLVETQPLAHVNGTVDAMTILTAAARVTIPPGGTSVRFGLFSDTIFAWHPDGGTPAATYDMILFSSVLLGNSMTALGGSAFLGLRGALSSGEAFCDDKHVAIQPSGLHLTKIIGKPVLRAVTWEKEQNWVGASLEPSSPNDLSQTQPQAWKRAISENLLLPWDVPNKRAAGGTLKTHAVNFLDDHASAQAILQKLIGLSNDPDPAIRMKYQASCDFVSHVSRQGSYRKAPIRQGSFIPLRTP